MSEPIVVDSKAGPLIRIRVTPRASRPRVAAGEGFLTVAVRSPAERGKATEEAVRAVAEALGLPRSALVLRRGATTRLKLLAVEGYTAPDLRKRIAERLSE